MTKTLTTQAVKAALREEGVRTIGGGAPRNREGIRLSQAGAQVRVVVDFNSEREALAAAKDLADLLSQRGFAVQREGATLAVAR